MRKFLEFSPYLLLVLFGLVVGWCLYPLLNLLFSFEQLLTHF